MGMGWGQGPRSGLEQGPQPINQSSLLSGFCEVEVAPFQAPMLPAREGAILGSLVFTWLCQSSSLKVQSQEARPRLKGDEEEPARVLHGPLLVLQVPASASRLSLAPRVARFLPGQDRATRLHPAWLAEP